MCCVCAVHYTFHLAVLYSSSCSRGSFSFFSLRAPLIRFHRVEATSERTEEPHLLRPGHKRNILITSTHFYFFSFPFHASYILTYIYITYIAPALRQLPCTCAVSRQYCRSVPHCCSCLVPNLTSIGFDYSSLSISCGCIHSPPAPWAPRIKDNSPPSPLSLSQCQRTCISIESASDVTHHGIFCGLGAVAENVLCEFFLHVPWLYFYAHTLCCPTFFAVFTSFRFANRLITKSQVLGCLIVLSPFPSSTESAITDTPILTQMLFFRFFLNDSSLYSYTVPGFTSITHCD